MKKVLSFTLLSFLLLVGFSFASTLTFDGNIDYHNDVVVFDFTLDADATDVRIWTDSFLSATNFDPITALWNASGNLLGQNDDDDSINPATQTYFDSGFTLPTLAAGDYTFTVAVYANFANGTTLAEGFGFDGQTSQTLFDYYHEDRGSYYRVNFDGVDDVVDPGGVSAVPEPATMLLFGLGLLGLAGVNRKKQ